MTRILCIWLPNWPIQRLVSQQPELAERPLILHDTPTGRGARVIACSAAARAAGLRVGMPLAEATAVVKRFTSTSRRLHLQRHDPQQDRVSLENLAEWCEQFSPCVGIEEGEQPESLLLDITGTATLFGDEASLVSQAQTQFQQRGWTVRLAVADTIGAAWGAAHFTPGSAVAVIIPPHDLTRLEKLSVEALRLPPAAIEVLQRLGITQLAQLLRLPTDSLPSRLGEELVLRLQQLTGQRAELITPHHPRPPLRVEWDFPYPTAHRASVEQAVSQSLDKLTTQLQQRGWGALQIECRLLCEEQRFAQIDLRLFAPTTDAQRLRELFRLQLDHQVLPGAVRGLTLQVLRHAPLERHQQDLFAGSTVRHAEHFAGLVNRLSSRLGSERIVRLQLVADAQPEYAYRKCSLTGDENRPPSATEQDLPRPLQRPLRMFHPPRPIEVTRTAPAGPPATLQLDGRTERVSHAWGPEEIVTGWWRGRSVRRDYYRIEVESHGRYWIFCRLQDEHWFLHGEFA